MLFSSLIPLSAVVAGVLSQTLQVPVPWQITNLVMGNTRHGTGGYWQFNILDTPTIPPQGFNTTCYYYGDYSYTFALDDPPYNEPCANPNVTFGIFADGEAFTFNVTHTWGTCGTGPCIDNGTWQFSYDDVRGQENDVQNNFGQSGGFASSYIGMYPTRTVASTKCEFC
ncbi:hypothetical protein B7494_g8435 [Chlorociboria aeruginascens]|nr:hypothetical protein B7494_g8435 [Chlorociboria aeruginascens]